MVYYLKNGHWREMKKTRLAEKLWSYPVKSEVLLNSRTNMERTTVPSAQYHGLHLKNSRNVCRVMINLLTVQNRTEKPLGFYYDPGYNICPLQREAVT